MDHMATDVTEPAASLGFCWRLRAGLRRAAAGSGGLLRGGLVVVLSLLTGCESPTVFSLPGAPGSQALYASLYPYYIEPCAVSALKKKPGFGFEYRGGPGGHAVVYLNGVCRDSKQAYPVVEMCDDRVPEAEAGVGLSSNGHFANAAWVATPGRDFFFDGALRPGEGVDVASYDRTQARAKRLGIMDGIRFHEDAFEGQPAGMSRADFKYEASVATDYGVSLGRGRFCARLPVSRAQMERVVAWANAENAQYRDGRRTFEMTVLGDNCSHFTHNLLAAAGFWDQWPTDRFILVSALSFPVPKNEFVNQMRQANDLPIDDPVVLFRDATTRQALLRDDWLPTEPGAIAIATPIRGENEIYDTDVGLIFYDSPIPGMFKRHFDRIEADRRYTDLADNLRYFAAEYGRIGADRRPASWWLARDGLPRRDDPAFAAFVRSYYDYIDRMAGRARLALAAVQPKVDLAAR